MFWITKILVTGATEEEDLENIQDPIVDYLSVVDELTQESEIRYVEVARDAKFSGVSHKRAIKAFEKTGFSCSETMKTWNDDKWRTNFDHSAGKSYQRLYYGWNCEGCAGLTIEEFKK